MNLNLLAEYGNDCLREIGSPLGFWRFPDRKMVAVSSSYLLNTASDRCSESASFLHERVALYAADTAELISTFHDFYLPVNDIALHPSEPLALIAYGAYDGGLMCRGNALLWNWLTGKAEKLLTEGREVTHCRFEAGGELISLLLHPACDGDIDETDCSLVYLRVQLKTSELFPLPVERLENGFESDPRLQALPVVDPESLGFKRLAARWEHVDPTPLINEWLKPLGKNFERRELVSDLKWLGDDRLLALAANGLLDIWHGPTRKTLFSPGRSVAHQILQVGESSRFCVVTYPYVMHRFQRPGTSIKLFDATDESLEDLDDLSGEYLFRRTAAGQLLGIRSRTSPFEGPDVVNCVAISVDLDFAEFETTVLVPLIRTVCFKDASGFLFFEKPRHKLEFKSLLDIESFVSALGESTVQTMLDYSPHTHELTAVWDSAPTDRDGMSIARGVAIEIEDAIGLSLVLALLSEKFVPRQVTKSYSSLERRAYDQGRVIWRFSLEGQDVLDLCWFPERSCIVVALSNGEILLVDANDGRVLNRSHLQFAGVPSLAVTLAARGNRLAVGTLEGRIAVFELIP